MDLEKRMESYRQILENEMQDRADQRIDYLVKRYEQENSTVTSLQKKEEIIDWNEENITESKENIQKKEEKKINIISKLIKRIRSTNYFFLINPIEFMIDVEHQNIQFIVILKFNGLVWKVNKIKIPYSKLVNKKEINLGD